MNCYSAESEEKPHLKLVYRLPDKMNEHTVCTPVFCINRYLTTGQVYLQNRC